MHTDQFSNVLTEDDIDFDAYLKETDHSEMVRPARDYLDDIMHVLSPAHDAPKHPRMPFRGAWIEFRPGEVTLWGGFNGSGKSMLQGQVMAEFAEKGERACIASLEMKPAKTLARINRQIFGVAVPSRNQVVEFLDRTSGRLWLYDQQGTVQTERMIAVIKHCAEKLGCQHIAIDSLMKCIRGFDDYNAQKNFVDTLTACARDYNIHIHLVAHLKKGETDERMPTRMDIKGAGDIVDLVDNVLLVWRNKKKERDIESARPVNDEDPDSMLICDKQRNGDWEGRVKLWYDKASLKFTDYNRNAKRGLAQNLV